MTEIQHKRAIRAALQAGDDIEAFFRQMGTADAPRGFVLSHYRRLRPSMRSALRSGNLSLINDLLSDTRFSLSAQIQTLLKDSFDAGIVSGEKALGVYDIIPTTDPTTVYSGVVSDASRAMTDLLEFQTNSAYALAVSGLDDELIVGDDDRAGILTPGAIERETGKWIAFLLALGWGSLVNSTLETRGIRQDFLRQAVAALDRRTTDCCLRVHGQTVGINEDFRLDGTPRFANKLHDPPFHWWCRTSVALLRVEDANDSLTLQMLDSAQAEIDARITTGRRADIHPAHARSRR